MSSVCPRLLSGQEHLSEKSILIWSGRHIDFPQRIPYRHRVASEVSEIRKKWHAAVIKITHSKCGCRPWGTRSVTRSCPIATAKSIFRHPRARRMFVINPGLSRECLEALGTSLTINYKVQNASLTRTFLTKTRFAWERSIVWNSSAFEFIFFVSASLIRAEVWPARHRRELIPIFRGGWNSLCLLK